MNNNFLKYIFLAFSLSTVGISYSQQDTLNPLSQLDLMDFNQVDFYGSIRARLTAYDENIEIQNNGTRLGVNLNAFWNKEKEYSIIGRMEWSVNVVANDFEFNLEANDASGFAKAERVGGNNPFGMRLGFVGLNFNQYGKVTIGKQWGVYYDVAKATDRFFVFGGSSLGTFVNGSDGGTIGTGRAEKALQYRLSLGNWKLGSQIQYRGVTGNSSQGDGYGLSLVYQPESLNMTFGAAFNRVKFAESTVEVLAGASENANSFVASVNYWEGTKTASHQSRIYAALGYAFIDSAEGVDADSLTVVYSAHGLEGVFQYQFFEKLSLMAGFNFQFPYDLNDFIDNDFMKRQYILGLFYTLTPGGYVYLEGLINDSTNQFGIKGTNVLALGMRFNFSMGKERQKLLEYFY